MSSLTHPSDPPTHGTHVEVDYHPDKRHPCWNQYALGWSPSHPYCPRGASQPKSPPLRSAVRPPNSASTTERFTGGSSCQAAIAACLIFSSMACSKAR